MDLSLFCAVVWCDYRYVDVYIHTEQEENITQKNSPENREQDAVLQTPPSGRVRIRAV